MSELGGITSYHCSDNVSTEWNKSITIASKLYMRVNWVG